MDKHWEEVHKRNTHPPYTSYPTPHSILHTPYPLPHIYGSLEAGGVVLDPLDVTIGDNKLMWTTIVFVYSSQEASFSRHLVVKKKQDLFRSVEVHIPEDY